MSDSGQIAIKTSNKSNVIAENGWVGAAAIVNIPEDDTNYKYTNFKAHFQYNGHITNTASPGYFMSAGNYCHTKAAVTLSDITIQMKTVKNIGKENVFAGLIGLKIGVSREAYPVVLEVKYTP